MPKLKNDSVGLDQVFPRKLGEEHIGVDPRLSKALNFEYRDLLLNRDGEQSEHQQRLLSNEVRRAKNVTLKRGIFDFSAAATFTLIMLVLMLTSSEPPILRGVCAIPLWFIITFSLLLDLISHVNKWLEIRTDIYTGFLKAVEGQVRTDVKFRSEFFVYVHSMTFRVSQAVMLAFNNEADYRIYYLPASKMMLSAEPSGRMVVDVINLSKLKNDELPPETVEIDEYLSQTVGFTALDLVANRDGYISPDQRQQLQSQGRNEVLGPLFVCLIILFVLFVGMLGWLWVRPEDTAFCIFVCFVPLSLVVAALAIRQWSPYLKDLNDGMIVTVEGHARPESSGISRKPGFGKVSIPEWDVTLSAPGIALSEFKQDEIYRFHYTPYSKILLSAEPIKAKRGD